MFVTLGQVRQFAREGKVTASPKYLAKERVRQHLQDHVVELLKSGEVSTPEELSDLWDTVDMAVKALKVVPLSVWKKMAGKTR